LGLKLLRKGTKCKIHTTLIRPVVIYRCESWTLTKNDEGKLSTFEGRILREIYGPSCVNGVCRIKNNDELYSLYKEPSTVKMMKIAKIKMIRTHSKDGE
jgi:hypothetical protein